MSLKTFVELPAIRQTIDKAMHFPRLAGDFPMRVAPRSRRFSLIGTAYDYLLRFMLERANGTKVLTRPWVAEGALRAFLFNRSALVIQVDGSDSSLDLDSSLERLGGPDRETAMAIQRIPEEARERHHRYLADNRIDNGLVACTVKLAKLDLLPRVGRLPEDFDFVEPDDVDELRQLAEVTPMGEFLASAICVLNPTFGEASRLVGGADGDLLIDGTLIDVKTTIDLPLKKQHQRQLVGYIVLASIGGVDGTTGSTGEIQRVGFYSSRFGKLITYSVADVLDVARLSRLAAAFHEHAPDRRAKGANI